MTVLDILLWLVSTAAMIGGSLVVFPLLRHDLWFWLPFVMTLLVLLVPYLMWAWLRERRHNTRRWG